MGLFSMPKSTPTTAPGGLSPGLVNALSSTSDNQAADGSASEYNTPLSTPLGQEFPSQGASSSQYLAPRRPPPTRPPRSDDASFSHINHSYFVQPQLSHASRSLDDLGTLRKLHAQHPSHESSQSGPQLDWPLQLGSTSTAPRQPPGKTAPSPRRIGTSPHPLRNLITPILEEGPEPNTEARHSAASSRVVPSSWGSHPEDYNFDRVKEKFEDGYDNAQSPASPESTASMHDDTSGLVRQASLGKKMKPSMTQIRSSAENKPTPSNSTDQGLRSSATTAIRTSGNHPAPMQIPESDVGRGGLRNLDPAKDQSSGSSGVSSLKSGDRFVDIAMPPAGRSRSPFPAMTEGSARHSDRPVDRTELLATDVPSAQEKVNTRRRPPPLDMNAVRDSGTRGSASSLPDLIRRATKLAANLERGKTASRAGILEIIEAEKKDRQRQSGSISDLLASFPPPSHGTPDVLRMDQKWPKTHLSSKLQNQQVSSMPSSPQESRASGGRHQGRRCCGMPLWVLILLVLLLLAVIAAAIAVPVTLIVLPREQQQANNDALPRGLTDCSGSISCKNGGVGVSDGNACRCICVNGFTGKHCRQAPGPRCSFVDVDTGSERLDRATVGSEIPPLFGRARDDFGVPLQQGVLLSLFSAEGLSCTSQNSLVRLEPERRRKRQTGEHLHAEESRSITSFSTGRSEPTPTLAPRQVVTSNGIIFQRSSTDGTASSPTASSDLRSAEPDDDEASSPPFLSDQAPTSDMLDFARIGILLFFEQSQELAGAIEAQERIRDFVLNLPRRDDTLSLDSEEGNFRLDLANFSIVLQNNTQVGGMGDGQGNVRGMMTPP